MSEPATAVSSPPKSSAGWRDRKFILLVALALVAHVALIFVFGTKKGIVPRGVGKVPHLQLVDSAGEFIQLDDPTLFALPNAHDFVSAFWRRPPAVAQPDFMAAPPPFFLAAPTNKFGMAFRDFMRANPPRPLPMDFNPEPELTLPEVAFDSAVPQTTTAEITGELARRPLLTPLTNLPAIRVNDVIAPSKVQVLVDEAGNGASVVVLESSGLPEADQRALRLARNLRFAPAPALTFGEITFRWHTLPAASTNAP